MKFLKKVLILFFKPSVFKIGLVITLVFASLSFFHGKLTILDFLTTIEMKYLDFRFQNRGYIPAGDNVVLITVDEKSIQQIGRWPWKRDVIAKLVTKLKGYGIKVFSFDAFFSEPEQNSITGALQKAEREYKKSTKRRRSKKFLKYLEEEAKRADTDVILSNAIEKAEDNVVLGYAFFLSSQEIEGIDQSTFARHFSNIEDSQIQMVFAPEEDERGSPDLTYDKAKGVLTNITILSEKTDHHAFVNAKPDNDGPIRKSYMFMPFENDDEVAYFPSLALKSVMRFLDEEIILRLKYDSEIFHATKVEDISFACITGEDRSKKELEGMKKFLCPKLADGTLDEEQKINIPVDEEGRFLINYRGPAKTFPHYSIADILNNKKTIKASYYDGDKIVTKKEAFGGKIGIFGATAIGVFDLRNTPFSSVYPGLEIHANVIDNILQGDFLTRSDDMFWYEFLIILVSGIVLSLAFIKLTAMWAAILTVGTLVFYWYIDKTYFFSQGTWVHIVIPMFQVVFIYFSVNLFKYMTEEKQKRQIKGAFQQYVAADVVSEMLKDPDKLQLGGEKREITILFSDIRSFTTISEGLEPQELGKFLNMYLSPMTDIVIENTGTIDKYMGDAIMAIFGAPVNNEEHSVLACRTALLMMKHLGELRDDWKEKGYPESIHTMDIGIGLNSGFATVGNMGSTQIFDYTCMGDNVNLGSRLEGINKEYKTHIMISEFTNAMVKEKGMNTRPVDLVAVKGKKLPVAIYELIAEGAIPQEVQDQIGYTTEAFDLYKKQEWDKSIEMYKKAIDAVKGDPTAQLFIDRCKDYKGDPPGDDWTGVHIMKTK
jgi:adenylate cyclase